jgi:hypothetical protein
MKGMPDWVKDFKPSEFPLTEMLPHLKGWSTPDFCIMEKKEPREPYFSWY